MHPFHALCLEGLDGLHEAADLWRARNPFFAHQPADHSHLRNHAIEAHIASKAA